MAEYQAYGSITTPSVVGTGLTVVASAARTANGNTAADLIDFKLRQCRMILWVLDITAVSGTTPTLDVAILGKIHGLYAVIAQFPTRTAVATRVLAHKRDLQPGQTLPASVIEQPLTTVAAATVVASATAAVSGVEWDDTFQAKWLIGGTTPSFTFSLTAYPIF